MEARAYLVIIILVSGVVELAPVITCHGSRDFAFDFYKMELTRLSLQAVKRDDLKRPLPVVTRSPPMANFRRSQDYTPPPLAS
ncbi:conserved hypothetical protein [Ricinus communis]|uniref:Uncharacterized protein n=1 Tax=Ricinus communis TaxID=3988 RepID=B9S7J6_RICCO|nr:conserved hypothetical protein [Ricinus communis]